MLSQVRMPPLAHGECALLSNLLLEALELLDQDASEARRRIECARTLVQGEGDDLGERSLLATWQRRRVEAYICDNVASSLRIGSVAAILNLSASYFSRAFKATVGITYSEFVLRERIGLAKKLLLTTMTPIAEIALACGFNDQSHLTRTFSQTVGCPPAAWRRSHNRERGGLQPWRPDTFQIRDRSRAEPARLEA